MNYQAITKEDFESIFSLTPEADKFVLKYPHGANTIRIKIPFLLNEDCAMLAGLIPDGCIISDLKRIYFSQKKDLSKITLFKELIENTFSPSNKVFVRQGNNCHEAYTNSRCLAMFFYKFLEIPKADEPMRVPGWIFNSQESVKLAYLKQAFDMEGTILKSLREIRFISKHKEFASDLQRLLNKLSITSTVNSRIGGTHRTTQYRLSIYGKENFLKFDKIGFRIPFLANRWQNLLSHYRNV